MKKILIPAIILILLLITIANAEFLGNVMRSPEERLEHATKDVTEHEKDLIEAMKEKIAARKDVTIDKGEKEQKKPFEEQDQVEITRLSNVLKEDKLKIEKLNAGQYCFPEGQ